MKATQPMRDVRVAVELPDTSAITAFETVQRFDLYPQHSPVVRNVKVQGDRSDWDVYFRNGILRWTESDEPDPDQLVIKFRQLDGDFDSFHGVWRIVPQSGGGCLVDFRATFDFGIPSLAGILEPVAERVIKDTIGTVLSRLFAPAAAVVS
ncbi:type II toxin-antitoxin system RatA family toxin [Streptomyces mauvecolor]